LKHREWDLGRTLKAGCNTNVSWFLNITPNIRGLCAVGELEAESINIPPKLNSSTNAQSTTKAPIAQNQCCAYVAVNLG